MNLNLFAYVLFLYKIMSVYVTQFTYTPFLSVVMWSCVNKSYSPPKKEKNKQPEKKKNV